MTDSTVLAAAYRPFRRVVGVIVALAYVLTLVWFVWAAFDSSGMPRAFVVASVLAAVIVVLDAGWRLRRSRGT
jgi:hypothetical protein